MKKGVNIVASILAIAALLGLDQWTKNLAATYLRPMGTIEFIPGLLRWNYTENTGMAFGLFNNNLTLLSILTSCALLVVLYLLYFYKPLNGFARVCLVGLFAGGAGNLIDRFFRGYVIDFAEFQFISFPVFNFADVLVTCSVFVLFAYMLLNELKLWRKKRAQGEENEKKEPHG